MTHQDPVRRRCAEQLTDLILRGQWHKQPAHEVLAGVVKLIREWEGTEPITLANPITLVQAKNFARETTWRFATSMADNPHWYIVVPDVRDERLSALQRLLVHHSKVRRWHKLTYRTVTLDGWDIWDIWPVINAKPTRYAGWDGDPKPPEHWLPKGWARDLQGDEREQMLTEALQAEAPQLFDPDLPPDCERR